MDKAVDAVANTLPQLAISQFTSKCLIDEILLTNNIEGVHSTRKEIGEILQDLSTRDKRNRFVGLVAKYAALEDNQSMSFKTCQDIRKVYDDIFYEEIKATDPENLPDGEMFRKSGVEVQSATQKVIHKGLSPESKIIDTMNQSLAVLNNDDIDIFIRIAVFHYLFGYIHPFYDGNGRTSRFISSYLLSRQLNPLIGYRLSYIVLGCSLPFVLLSEWLGSLIGVLSGLCLIAMLFAWHFGDLEGKYVIGCTAILGLLSALFFGAEEIATAIQCKLDSVSEFFGDLISDIWE